jgi:hypothetical protein
MDELLARLLTPALICLLLAAATLVLFNDWRLRLAALAVQYVAAAILVTQVVRVEVAFAKFVAGCLVVAILVITASRFNLDTSGLTELPAGADDMPRARRFEVPTGFPFRLMATLMFVIAAIYLATRPNMVLPGLQVAPAINIASYLLMALGLLNLGLSEEPMRAGTGLLTLLTGFEIFYAVVEPSLAIVALLAAAQFGVALAVSYLTVLQHSGQDEIANA